MASALRDPILGNEEVIRGESQTIKDVWGDTGGYVYGLSTIFSGAKEHQLEPPEDMADLKRLLREHLYVEGGPENIQVDDHSVRVLTDDDEVQLAYFFFDDVALARPEVAWLLHDEPRLPADAAPSRGPARTTACLFTSYDGQSIPGQVHVFEGVRLPELADYLRETIPGAKPWPLELRLLRAMIDPDDSTIEPALERVNAYPIMAVGSRTLHSQAGIGDHESARDEFAELADGETSDGDPSQSIIDLHDHCALFAMHTTRAFGFQQWVLFDDQWAAAHPDLAESLVCYGTRWDPLAIARPKRAPDIPQTAEQLSERAWKAQLGDRTTGRAYRVSEAFAVGEVIDHPKFGLGVVRNAGDKIDVIFRDAPRLLVHKKR
ncbi:MAG: hypothetical protein QM831_43745 [Kofleriaceae bacterium]